MGFIFRLVLVVSPITRFRVSPACGMALPQVLGTACVIRARVFRPDTSARPGVRGYVLSDVFTCGRSLGVSCAAGNNRAGGGWDRRVQRENPHARDGAAGSNATRSKTSLGSIYVGSWSLEFPWYSELGACGFPSRHWTGRFAVPARPPVLDRGHPLVGRRSQ